MSTSALLSLAAWNFLPGYATSSLQWLYYKITIRAGAARPLPGTPRYAEHYRRIYLIVVSLYLLFTIYEADWELQSDGDFYSTLGVLPNATDKDMKRRYRVLSAAIHPDKVAPGTYNQDTYTHLQNAHETLTNEVKRFAYDRFGPAMLDWNDCILVRDYVLAGAQRLLGYYGAGAVALLALPRLGYFRDGLYWRWLAFLALAVFELHTITRPDHPPVLARVVNPLLVRVVNPLLARCRRWLPAGGRGRGGAAAAAAAAAAAHAPMLPFQAVALARRLGVALSLALSQVVPYLAADTRSGRVEFRRRGPGGEAARAEQSLAALDAALRRVEGEATHTAQLVAMPFTADPRLLATLRLRTKRWLVDNTIRNEPVTKEAISSRIARRRQDAPSGAQGNGAKPRQGYLTVADDA